MIANDQYYLFGSISSHKSVNFEGVCHFGRSCGLSVGGFGKEYDNTQVGGQLEFHYSDLVCPALDYLRKL